MQASLISIYRWYITVVKWLILGSVINDEGEKNVDKKLREGNICKQTRGQIKKKYNNDIWDNTM